MTLQMVAKLQRNKIVELFNSILNDEKIQEFLKRLEDYHKETYEHSLRVGFLSMFLGAENNFSEGEIELLGYAGLLHDLGKLDISKNILNKESELSEDERSEIEGHPRKGFLILKDFEEIREIIVQSHEYQKGSYPRKCERRKAKRDGGDRRKVKKCFCVLAQVVSIADMFDALSNERAYKKALSNEEVKKILEETFTGEKTYIEQVVDIGDGEKSGTI